MTATYDADTLVTVELTAPLEAGVPVAATGVEYAVSDEAGEEVIARQALSSYVTSDPTVSIPVPAINNALPAGVSFGLRKIDVYFTVASGDVRRVSMSYIVGSVSKLVLMTNSFQTYEQALLTRMEFPALAGWDAASEAMQISAMIAAHDNMCRLSYKYATEADVLSLASVTDFNQHGQPYYYVPSMRLATTTDHASFSAPFKRALKRAQIVEADILLAGDPIGNKRREGIIAETIGESKIFLQSRTPLQMVVSRACVDQLTGFIHRNNRISRV